MVSILILFPNTSCYENVVIIIGNCQIMQGDVLHMNIRKISAIVVALCCPFSRNLVLLD